MGTESHDKTAWDSKDERAKRTDKHTSEKDEGTKHEERIVEIMTTKITTEHQLIIKTNWFRWRKVDVKQGRWRDKARKQNNRETSHDKMAWKLRNKKNIDNKKKKANKMKKWERAIFEDRIATNWVLNFVTKWQITSFLSGKKLIKWNVRRWLEIQIKNWISGKTQTKWNTVKLYWNLWGDG